MARPVLFRSHGARGAKGKRKGIERMNTMNALLDVDGLETLTEAEASGSNGGFWPIALAVIGIGVSVYTWAYPRGGSGGGGGGCPVLKK